MKPHVFVVMPFGKKEAVPVLLADDGEKVAKKAVSIDFTDIYNQLIGPALERAGCQAFRADQEEKPGNINKDMFYELVTADLIVADISILNPNVFYELGIRHGVRPDGIFMIHGGWSKRPFDVAPERSFGYTGSLFETKEAERDDAWKQKVQAEVAQLSGTLGRAFDGDRNATGSPVYNLLPGMKAANWSNIQAAQAKYFGQVFGDLRARVEVAKANKLPGDILTLAEDAPTRTLRTKLLWEAAKALIALLRCEPALIALEALLTLDEANLDAQAQKGLTLGRLGRTQEAKVYLTNIIQDFKGNAESQGAMGRIYKDLWRLEWEGGATLKDRQSDAADAATKAVDAIRSYNIAFKRELGSYYTGINVISLVKLLEHLHRVTGLVLTDHKITDLDDLIAVVRTGATIAYNNAGTRDDHVEMIWSAATLGELALLTTEGELAMNKYREAANTTDVTYFMVDSMLTQLQLFAGLGFRDNIVTPIIEMLTRRRDKLQVPGPKYDKVFLCSGHLIDADDRVQKGKAERFPRGKEGVIGGLIAAQLDQWGIGPNDLAICGGARGADILFAEYCVKKGARVWIFLSLDDGEFLKQSVRLPNSDWEERFFALQRQPNVQFFSQVKRLKEAPKGVDPFARANLWMINSAKAEVNTLDNIYSLLVWDEKDEGDGPGGTADFARRCETLGGRLAIINPLKH